MENRNDHRIQCALDPRMIMSVDENTEFNTDHDCIINLNRQLDQAEARRMWLEQQLAWSRNELFKTREKILEYQTAANSKVNASGYTADVVMGALKHIQQIETRMQNQPDIRENNFIKIPGTNGQWARSGGPGFPG